MKILAICGSPRKGNTYSTLNTIKEKFPDIEYKLLMLNQINLETCKGCYVCILRGEDKCPIKDDRDMIIKEILGVDGIIFASPVYVLQVSSIMKNFIDRFAYYAHRPRFYDKFAMSMVTCSGYGAKETTKYMNKIFSAFGFNMITPLELQFLPGKMPEKLILLNNEKTKKAFETLFERVNKGERNKPTMEILVPFNLFKAPSKIDKDVMYALNKHDNHLFRATEECVLICVFNPPLTGNEVHKEDNSY